MDFFLDREKISKKLYFCVIFILISREKLKINLIPHNKEPTKSLRIERSNLSNLFLTPDDINRWFASTDVRLIDHIVMQ